MVAGITAMREYIYSCQEHNWNIFHHCKLQSSRVSSEIAPTANPVAARDRKLCDRNNLEKHLAKIGHKEVKDKVCLSDVSDDNIAAIIKEAKEEAVKAIKDLRMVVKGGKWEERSHKTRITNHNSDKRQ